MHPQKHSQAFTLIEIVIVVTIVGLLAAMAIPAFGMVSTRSTYSALMNDARQLAGGAQQHFMQTGESTITFTVEEDGRIEGAMRSYVKRISPNYIAVSEEIEIGGTFSISHRRYLNGTPVVFTDQGAVVE